MTKPLYFYNGTTFEQIGPTTPQSPIAYQTSAPTGPATGDLWIDSDGDVDTYNRQLTRYYFVATAGQTTISGADANSLTLAYVAGSEAVYVNGALQVRGQDYTATNGTSVVMSSGLAVNDVVEIFAYTAFTVANAYTKSEIDSLRIGNVVKVVSTTKTDTFSTSSASFVDITGLSASITPLFSTSKILILANFAIGSSPDRDVKVNLVRGSTNIAQSTGATGNSTTYSYPSSIYSLNDISINFLDSPATTSSTTYKIQINTSGSTTYVGRRGSDTGYGAISTITLMEVLA